MKALTLTMEISQFQQQQLRHKVSILEGKCASLVNDAKAIEDRVNQAYEQQVHEFRNSEEIKKKIYKLWVIIRALKLPEMPQLLP